MKARKRVQRAGRVNKEYGYTKSGAEFVAFEISPATEFSPGTSLDRTLSEIETLINAHRMRKQNALAGGESGAARRRKNAALALAVENDRKLHPDSKVSQVAARLFLRFGKSGKGRQQGLAALAKKIRRLRVS